MNVAISWPEGWPDEGDGGTAAFVSNGLADGAAHWERDSAIGDDPDALSFVCPCGCKTVVGFLSVLKGPKMPGFWQWDGDLIAPTLTPSIRRLDHCRWHGWLRAGVFTNE